MLVGMLLFGFILIKDKILYTTDKYELRDHNNEIIESCFFEKPGLILFFIKKKFNFNVLLTISDEQAIGINEGGLPIKVFKNIFFIKSFKWTWSGEVTKVDNDLMFNNIKFYSYELGEKDSVLRVTRRK